MAKACCSRRLCFAGRLSRFSLKTREHLVVELLTCYFYVFKVKSWCKTILFLPKKHSLCQLKEKLGADSNLDHDSEYIRMEICFGFVSRI